MLGLLVGLLAAGQVATKPVAPVAPLTLQQRFDAGTAAATAGRCAEAIRLFSAMEETGALRRNPFLGATVDVRRGGCLVRTGRRAEGVAAIRRGLPMLVAKGAEFAGDVRDAHLTLGAAAWSQLDYDAAEREYRTAIDGSQGVERINPLILLSRVLMFDHDGRALAAATEARTLALATPDISKKDAAYVQTQYARVLLNEGRAVEAYKELKASLTKQGGLSTTVGATDIATRSDLAIAAFQNKDLDAARLYLAYAGAGRTRDTPFASAAMMDPPVCGGDSGLSPDDYGIVEFTLEDDGHVSTVAPIYATGDRKKALAFARAVADWSWTAEAARKIPLLFRYTTRVEIRCVRSTSIPSLTAPLREAAENWVATKSTATPAWTDLSAATALPLQRAALTRAQAAQDRPAVLQAALALVANPVGTGPENETALTAALAIVTTLNAPAPVRTYVAVLDRTAHRTGDTDQYRAGLRSLLAQPDIANDALSAATLRLLIAVPAYKGPPPHDAAALLDAIIDGTLPAQHPLRTAALLGKANTLAGTGDLAGARAAFDRTGLSAEQCAMIGLTPALRKSNASSSDFPMEAMAMGFEGWVSTEFDVAPDGRTILPRAVTAYPPYVFDRAAVGVVRDARFTSSFRPQGALACSGLRQNIMFRIP